MRRRSGAAATRGDQTEGGSVTREVQIRVLDYNDFPEVEVPQDQWTIADPNTGADFPLFSPDDGNPPANPSLVVRIWREMIGDSLSVQGPFHINVWGGKDPGRAVELARHRFGAAPPLRQFAKPEDAIAATRADRPGGVDYTQ